MLSLTINEAVPIFITLEGQPCVKLKLSSLGKWVDKMDDLLYEER